jgi:hypothetical protein
MPPALERAQDGDRGRGRHLRAVELQSGVVAQNQALELPQLGARRQSELVAQEPARLPVGGERIGLAAGAVQREHQLSSQPLLQRRGGDQPLQLHDDLGSTAERKLRVDPLHIRRQTQLLQAPDLGVQLVDPRKAGERRAAPQVEGLAQPRRGGRRVGMREQRAALLDQPLEHHRVELLGLELEHVSAAARSEHLGRVVAEGPTQTGHRHMDGVRRARARAARQSLDQLFGADELVRVDEEEPEQRLLALPAERKRLAIQDSRQRPEDPELHRGPPQRAHCVDYRPTPRGAQRFV